MLRIPITRLLVLPMALLLPAGGLVAAGNLNYTKGKAYVYTIDSTCTTNVVADASSTMGTSSKPSLASRVTGQFRLIPVNSTSTGTAMVVSVDPGTQVQTRDENGFWSTNSVDTSLLQQQTCMIEHRSDGSIRTINFKQISQASPDPKYYAKTQSVQNLVKGLVSLLDFRMTDGTVTITDGADTSGTFTATYTRTDATHIQVVKSSYSAFASGMGVYKMQGDYVTPAAQAQMKVSSTDTITLDASNLVASRSFNGNFSVDSTDPGPGGPATFAGSGNATVTGSITRLSVENADLTQYPTTSYTVAQTLQSQLCCGDVKAAWRDQGQLDADVAAAVLRIQQGIGSRQGGMLALAQAIRRGGDIAPARTSLLSTATASVDAQVIAAALGVAPTQPARDLIRDSLLKTVLPDEVTAQALMSVQQVPVPSQDLINAVQFVINTGPAELSLMATQTLGAMSATLATVAPEKATRINTDLRYRFSQAKTSTEQAALLLALGNTRDRDILRLVRGYAYSENVQLRRAAQRVLSRNDQDADGRNLPSMAGLQGGTTQGIVNTVVQSDMTMDSDPNRFCPDFTSSLTYATDSNHNLCGLPRIESAGSKWLGGSIWTDYAAATDSAVSQGDFRIGGSLDGHILCIPFNLAKGMANAHYDKTGSTSQISYEYSYLGGGDHNGTFDLDMEIPDDPAYPAFKKPFQRAGTEYRVCGQVFIFTICFEAGIGAETGLEAKYGGFKALPPNANNDPTVYCKIGPYADVSAYLEGSIGFFCLDVALRLEGDFLKVAFPARLDLDPIGTRTTSTATATPNLYISADEEVTPWALTLYGRFDYCIGSKTKKLWWESADAQTRELYTSAVNGTDLTITALTTTPGLGLIDTTKPLTVTATVTNNGPGTSPPNRPVVTDVALGGLSGSYKVLLGDGSTPKRLRTGESFTGRVVLTPLTAGTFTLSATANPSRLDKARILDSNNSNDSKSTSLTVKPAYPDLVVKSAQLVKASSVQGDTVQLGIAFANIGPGADPRTCTHVYDPDLQRTILECTPTPVHGRVLSGTAVLAEFDALVTNNPVTTVSFPSALNGVWLSSVSVDVDAPNAVVELDESNNRMNYVSIRRVDTAVPSITLTDLGLIYSSMNNAPSPTPPYTRDQEFHRIVVSVVEDSYIDRLDYYIDGLRCAGSPTIPSAGSFTVNYDFQTVASLGFAEGNHTFSVKATDKSGKVGSSTTLNFTVKHPDLIAPTGVAKIVDLNQNLLLYATQLKDTGGTTPGIDHVDFMLDNKLVKTVFMPFLLTTTNGGVLRASTPNDASLAGGLHTLTIKIWDKEGNWAFGQPATFSKDQVYQEVDTTPELGLGNNNAITVANTLNSYTRMIKGFCSDADFFKIPVPPGKTVTLVESDETGLGLPVTLSTAAGTILTSGRQGWPMLNYTNSTTGTVYLYLSINTYYEYDPDLRRSLLQMDYYSIQLTFN